MNIKNEQNSCLKIAVLSLADINNYGDKFFPYLFRSQLQQRFPMAKIDLYTNMAYRCELYETFEYSLHRMENYDAIILAGGDTIQRLDTESWNDIYPLSLKNRKPSDIIFDWLDLKKPYKAYFSVGVHPHMSQYRQDVLNMLKNLDFLAVRGELAKETLEGNLIFNYNNIRIVPDLGWMFNQYIDELEKNSSLIYLPPSDYMVFELFYEGDDEIIPFVAKTLRQFQDETGVQVVLLPIVHTKSRNVLSSWNDYYPLSKVQACTNNTLILMPDLLNVAEIGVLLKHAKFYLGSSMHGAVTCLSYGKPAGNILTWTAPKLQDLHGARMRTDCFVNHWGRLPELLQKLNIEAEDDICRKSNLQYADYMRYRLSSEIDGLCLQIYNQRASTNITSCRTELPR